MAVNRGKQFEKVIEKTLCEIPNINCERLHDQVSGYIEVSKNPSDFIVYKYPYEYYIECKTTHQASIALDKLVQLDRIAKRCTVDGVKGKFIIWFVDKKETYWVDYKYLVLKRTLGIKSINHKILKEASLDKNLVKLIPAEYKIVFGKYDFSTMWEE